CADGAAPATRQAPPTAVEADAQWLLRSPRACSWRHSNGSSRRVHAMTARNGTLWQKDYFDRLIRDARHFWNCARYIRRNPEKSRLEHGEYLLYESEFVRTTLDGD